MEKLDSLRIVFTGDISFSKNYNGLWNNEILSQEVGDYLRNADCVVADIEGPLSASEHSGRELVHSSDPQAAEFLYRNNIRNWVLANNHIMDCGAKGIQDTYSCAEKYDCLCVGAGMNEEEASKPLILGNAVKVGILSVAKPWEKVRIQGDSAGALTWDKTDLIRAKISLLREECDWVVLIVHGGEEFSPIPLPYLRELYKTFLSYGVDIIIGHHPHVVQNYETIGEKLVVYSLGNFIFDTDHQRKFRHTAEGVLAAVNFDKEHFSLDSIGVCIDRNTHNITRIRVPDIFSDIGEREYELLWPLASRVYLHNDRIKKSAVNKKIKKVPSGLRWLYDVYQVKFIERRQAYLGCLKSVTGEWKNSSMEDIVEFLVGAVPDTNV